MLNTLLTRLCSHVRYFKINISFARSVHIFSEPEIVRA